MGTFTPYFCTHDAGPRTTAHACAGPWSLHAASSACGTVATPLCELPQCAVTERLLQRGMRAALASRCRQSCTRQSKRQGSRRGAVCQHPAVARAGGRQSCTRACSWNRSSPRRPAARLQLREALAEAQAAGRGRRRHCARRQRQHSGRPGLCPCAAHELRVGHISPRQALRHLHGNIRLPRLRQLGLIMDCSDSHMDCPGTRAQGPPRPARAPAWYK